MSLALLNEIILRVNSDPNYVTKGSELTWEELDTNLQIIANAIKELSEVEIEGLEPYNPAEENSLGDVRTYDGNTWRYVNAIPSTGVTPGTDPSTWAISSQGLYSHVRNADTKLAEGTSDEVTASEIRTFINDSGVLTVMTTTTDGTPTLIHEFETDTDTVYTAYLMFIGRRTAGSGSNGDYVVTHYPIAFKNTAGTVTLLGTAFPLNLSSGGATGWGGISTNVSGTNFQIMVEGQTGFTIEWTMKIVSKVEG